jgi:HSP20 family protein
VRDGAKVEVQWATQDVRDLAEFAPSLPRPSRESRSRRAGTTFARARRERRERRERTGEMIMSDIQVKKNGPQQPLASAPIAPAQAWEPSRWLTQMMGWDPFREMAPFFPEERTTLAPAFEVKETKDGYHFKADVPGMKESDLDVSMTGNRLTITGKREAEKENKGDTFYTYERSYGSFTRASLCRTGSIRTRCTRVSRMASCRSSCRRSRSPRR